MHQTAKSTVQEKPDLYYTNALSLADRGDLDYEVRLEMLQTWLARIADGRAVRGTQHELEGAILALQARAKLKMDTPDGQPETSTYGGVERSNLRLYGARHLLRRLRRVFRR